MNEGEKLSNTCIDLQISNKYDKKMALGPSFLCKISALLYGIIYVDKKYPGAVCTWAGAFEELEGKRMRNGTIIITKNTQEIANAKNKRQAKIARSNFGVSKIVPLSEVHLYDMTRADEVSFTDMPASGADIFALIKKYNIREFGSGDDILDKIETVRVSEFGERYLLINVLETDPVLMHNEWLLQNRPDLVELGIKAVRKTCHFAKTVIATKVDANINGAIIKKFPSDFYYENESDILKIALDIELEKDETAATSGVLVIGIQTLITIGLTAAGVEPTTRYLTLANIKTKEAKVVRAPLSYLTTDLIAKVYGKPEGLKAYAGAGALNASPIELSPLVDYTTEMLAYAEPIEYKTNVYCNGCGDCMKICPMKLPVHAAVLLSRLDDSKLKRKEAKKYQDLNVSEIADECIRCGLCTYACQEGLDPMNLIAKTRHEEIRSRLVICKE